MAIPFLSDIKLNGNQIKELVVDHKSSSQPTSGYHGQLIFRTDENKIYINTSTSFNSPSWSSIAGDITSVTAGNGLTGDALTGDVTINVGPSKGITVSSNRVSVDPDGTTLDFDANDDSAKLRIASGGVDTTQLADDAVDGDKIANDSINSEHYVDGSIDEAHIADQQVTFAKMQQIQSPGLIGRNTSGTGIIEALSTGTVKTMLGITLPPAIEDNSGTPAFASGITKTEVQTLLNVADGANNYSLDLTKLNAVTSAMDENSTLTFGDGGNDTNVIIKGDLEVKGKTVTNNVETVSTSNGVVFEGSALDNNEGTLLAGTLTGDRTYTLPDKDGTVAMTSDITGTNSGVNTGDEPDATTTVKGIVELATNAEANAGTPTARAVTPANLQAFTGSSSIVTVGTISTGVWQGTAISTDYIANTSGTNTGDEPDADTSTKGIVALATLSQASTGTNSTRAVTPAGVKKFDDDRKYTEEITSAISANSGYDVDHGLGTRDVIVKVYALVTDLTTSGTDIVTQYDEVQIDVNHATTAKVVITPNIGIRAVATGSLKVLVKAL